jgi:hypothetical protein
MSVLRVICVESDCGDAAHVGGQPKVRHKTFDLPCPPALSQWLGRYMAYGHRSILATELIEPPAEATDKMSVTSAGLTTEGTNRARTQSPPGGEDTNR